MLAPLREPPHIEEEATEVQLSNYSVPPSCPRPFKLAKPKFGRSPGPSSYSLDVSYSLSLSLGDTPYYFYSICTIFARSNLLYFHADSSSDASSKTIRR
jgi:hypothetical protein